MLAKEGAISSTAIELTQFTQNILVNMREVLTYQTLREICDVMQMTLSSLLERDISIWFKFHLN